MYLQYSLKEFYNIFSQNFVSLYFEIVFDNPYLVKVIVSVCLWVKSSGTQKVKPRNIPHSILS